VLDTGGDATEAGFLYWIVGNSVTSSVSVGLKTADFKKDLTGLLPGSNYQFVAYAVNSAAQVVSDVKSFKTHAAASSLYVATNGNNTAGTNWITSYTNLQEALDNVEAGDTAYLAGQTFSNNPAFAQTDIWTLQGKSNITVIGGYAATNNTALPGVNDPTQWPTVLRRINANPARILHVDSVTNCTIQNVQILDGIATAGSSPQYAMGIYVNNSTGLTLNACLISNNIVSALGANGGGMYVTASAVTLTNCLITSCRAANVSNGGPGYGGGIDLNSGSMVIVNSVVRNCRADAINGGQMSGGGIFANTGTSLILRRSVLASNRADSNTYTNAPSYGGGLCSLGNFALLENCLVLNNGVNAVMIRHGDGIYTANGLMVVTNCTIASNLTQGVYQGSGTLVVNNSILWNNGDDLTGTMSVAYCDIQTADSFWTHNVNGCISTDPLFVDTTYYHLQARAGQYMGGYFSGGSWGSSPDNDSPCIDAGDPISPFNLEPAPNGHRVNMGAYGNTDVASSKLSPTAAVLMIY